MDLKSFNLSFEFFPPKTEGAKINLLNTAEKLNYFQPDFVSVTFGAAKSSREGTLETVKMIKEKINVSVAPHLSCSEEPTIIKKLLQAYKALNVKKMVILRGDVVPDINSELKYATDLVAMIKREFNHHIQIEVAAYPEVHPEAINIEKDVLNLKRKLDLGASGAITQFFFNADAYFSYVLYCRKMGINAPIVPGIMPIFNFNKLFKFAQCCGAEVPRWIQKRMEAYQHDELAMREFGIEVMSELCSRLIRNGAPGFHFYTLNQFELTEQILKNLNFKQYKVLKIMKK